LSLQNAGLENTWVQLTKNLARVSAALIM